MEILNLNLFLSQLLIDIISRCSDLFAYITAMNRIYISHRSELLEIPNVLTLSSTIILD